MVWVHLAFHLVQAIAKSRRDDARRKSPAHAPTPRGPPADADSARCLVLGARWVPMDGARQVRLTTGLGEIWVVLVDPPPTAAARASANSGESGDAVIGTRGRASGTSFVAAVANWLQSSLPAASAAHHPLGPFALRWRRGGWVAGGERVTLDFAWDGRAASVFLDLWESPPAARFVERQPSTRAALVAILATALRDGAPPAAPGNIRADRADDEGR